MARKRTQALTAEQIAAANAKWEAERSEAIAAEGLSDKALLDEVQRRAELDDAAFAKEVWEQIRGLVCLDDDTIKELCEENDIALWDDDAEKDAIENHRVTELCRLVIFHHSPFAFADLKAWLQEEVNIHS